jgi:hypothetical protein
MPDSSSYSSPKSRSAGMRTTNEDHVAVEVEQELQQQNLSTAATSAYPTLKMQMTSERDQPGNTDQVQQDVSIANAPILEEGMGIHQELSRNLAEPCDFPFSLADEFRKGRPGKDIPTEMHSRPMAQTATRWEGQPGAFHLVPGLPPIRAGQAFVDNETDGSHEESNIPSVARNCPLVVDATLVCHDCPPLVNLSDLQHAAEVDPAELAYVALRHNACILMTLLVLLFVSSSAVGTIVVINHNKKAWLFRNISFEEFVDTLLPAESLEQSTLDAASPQGQALEWLKRDTNGTTMVGWRMLQRYSLSVVFFSLNGNSWHNGSGWLSSSQECSWNTAAASCDVNGQISVLALCQNNLTGSIPNELSLLTGLKTILMKENSVAGTIPKSMFGLSQLTHLDLEDNLLEGAVPPELSSLTSLEEFIAAENLLNGTIPTELGLLSELRLLRIYSNNRQVC